ncbi:conserved membrane hypothetical protein [Nitrosopumilaceae archaeon]|nr:flippase-like domain-containing protein [Nitrosopumilus sp.]CAI9830796.1 conserved membrane hypothetical protein [Nitrosopumilaceae archaeon]MDA7944490.1 flippase-like domain-containing protein [Nitrosopumilus sp.]MDA7954242.1 flippase-like domain-containing protein [Nitrosopumilus sp.]MDA7973162.1 flippase-like domain-containing protein [Nitrosopumilus sp.]
MRWRLAVIPATLVPILVIAAQFDIGIEDVLAIGALPFAAAAGAMMAKLGLQGAKFAYITRSYLAGFDSVARLAGVRVGSEFVKFTTPMFVGAEFVVIYYLHKKGVDASRASWIAIMDIVTEVLAAGILSAVAGVIALAAGAYVVAAVVLGTSISVTSLWVALFFLSSRRNFQVPRPLAAAAVRVGGERAAKYVGKTDEWMSDICTMSREHMGTRKARRVFTVSFLLSLASWGFYGISFAAVAAGVGYAVGLLDSVMAVMAANAVGNLPITVGGSGLAEIGIIAYLNDLNPFDLGERGGDLEWDAVIGWRIATYYFPILVTWLLLVKLALSRIKGGAVEKSSTKT